MLCRMCFARGGAVHRGTKIGMGYRFLVDCICRFCYIEAFVIFGTMIRLRDVRECVYAKERSWLESGQFLMGIYVCICDHDTRVSMIYLLGVCGVDVWWRR